MQKSHNEMTNKTKITTKGFVDTFIFLFVDLKKIYYFLFLSEKIQIEPWG